jgi:hypothetical protein
MVADVDFFVSSGVPYRPKRADIDNAVLGPLANEANQYLTGVSVRRSLLDDFHPPASLTLGRSVRGSVRGVAVGLDDQGFLWLVEQLIPRTALQEAVDGGFNVSA